MTAHQINALCRRFYRCNVCIAQARVRLQATPGGNAQPVRWRDARLPADDAWGGAYNYYYSWTCSIVSSSHSISLHKQDIIRRHLRADNCRASLQVLNTLVPMAALWWLAVWSVGASWWITASAALLLSLFTLRVLVLMHECGHGSLFRNQRLNRAFGFLFGVITGMPQYVWSQHHTFHHAHNGNWEQYRGPLTTPSVEEYRAMSVAQQRTYRYSRHIALAPLGGFIYLLFNPRFTWIKGSFSLLLHRMRGRPASEFKTRYWNSAREYRHMSANNLVLFCIWALMCWAIGPALFFSVYVISVSLAGGAGIVLFTVQHNFEHSYASGNQDWDHDRGAVTGTSFLQLPPWLNWFTANIAYHHIHHLSSRIPNYRLVACHDEFSHLFGEVRRVSLAQIPSALKCLLWDRQAGRIISFAEYQRQQQAA